MRVSPRVEASTRMNRKECVMKPCAGDWVEIRSKNEILATLDSNGRLEGLPFMPHMFRFCGRRFQVQKRAHKACDTVSGNYTNRAVPNSVLLELRCDGGAFDGCQAACLIVWKEAWLNPVSGRDAPAIDRSVSEFPGRGPASAGCTIEDVIAGARMPQDGHAGATRYVCQATELLNYSTPMKNWDARQYVEDYRSGNASLKQVISVLSFAGFQKIARAPQLGRPARWLYDFIQSLRGGTPYPRRPGTLRPGEVSPIVDIDLKPGELVRVKSLDQILATVGPQNMHRGMSFDVEMVPYCGKVFRVRDRVAKFVDERTGLMKQLKTPAVILEGVTCGGRFSNGRWLCPRGIFPWWREAWLERTADTQTQKASDPARAA
jgi:hypothetical protein